MFCSIYLSGIVSFRLYWFMLHNSSFSRLFLFYFFHIRFAFEVRWERKKTTTTTANFFHLFGFCSPSFSQYSILKIVHNTAQRSECLYCYCISMEIKMYETRHERKFRTIERNIINNPLVYLMMMTTATV